MKRVLHAGASVTALLVCLATAPVGARATGSPDESDRRPSAFSQPTALPVPAVTQKTARLTRRAIALPPRRLAAPSTGDLEHLRRQLVQKLEALNAPPAAEVPMPASAAAAPPRPVCRPVFEMTSWQGGGFTERRAQLRAGIAVTRSAPESLAALAEFYLAHGLADEALDVAGEGIADGGNAADAARPTRDGDATRLRRDADLARLMRGKQIAATSPLLADRPDCGRSDLALWQALAAATAHDPAGIERTMAKAQGILRTLPDPVRPILAYRLADALEDGSTALPLIAEALRNTKASTQEDRAAALLLSARLAAAKGHRDDATSLLAQAADTGRSLPALQARVRLAEQAASVDGPLSRRGEAILVDFARIYRDNGLGQGAAATLAERKLREDDFAAALAIADQSARGGGRQRQQDRGGAAQIVRILRTLLVSPGEAHLPPPAARAALFLRYQGYATPGAQGDDIRIEAARLLLAQGLPQTALDVARQLAAPAAASPPGLAVRASAEAQGGDPAATLELLRNAPADADLRRAAALALARLGRPADAAGQLEGLTAIADRLQRARLLAEAKDWRAAAAAYAALLRDAELAGEARREASDRYGLAVVLSGGRPDQAILLPGDGLAARALAATPSKTGAQPGAATDAAGGSAHGAVAAMRGALQRARTIDTLLPHAQPSQGV